MPAITLRPVAALSANTALSPRLQEAVRLLHLPAADYERALLEAAERNPFLLVEPPSASAVAGMDLPPTDPGDGDHDEPAATEGWDVSAAPAGDGAADAEGAAGQVAAATLAGHLHAQLDYLQAPDTRASLARLVVECLDDDGYLRGGLAEVCALANQWGIPTRVDDAELGMALALVQSLEPAGVGARDLAECLGLQVRTVQPAALRALVRRIVAGHLPQVGARDYGGLAHTLRCSRGDIERACTCVRKLVPRPGAVLSGATAPLAVPDAIAHRQRGGWTARLNPAVMPRVRVDAAWPSDTGKAPAPLSDALREARWLVGNAAQRFVTILAVSRAVVRQQAAFFEHGALALKPLGLQAIADEVGVHASTVSRVTHGKYLATPHGTFELKRFFSRPVAAASGAECAPAAVRELLRTIVAEEPASMPLSDGALTQALAGHGFSMTRRTVTKYRTALRIPSAAMRVASGVR